MGCRGRLGLESGDTGARFGAGVKVVHRCEPLCEPESCPVQSACTEVLLGPGAVFSALCP